MNNSVKTGLIFVGGIATGALGMWIGIKDHYRTLYENDVESVKESLEAIYKTEKKTQEALNKPDILEVAKNLEKTPAPVNDYQKAVENAKPLKTENEIISIITADEFAANKSGYAQVDFFYFKDGVLTDDIYQEISNPSSYLGDAYHDLIENSNVDALYFSNPAMEMEIAVAKDLRTFEEAKDESPY